MINESDKIFFNAGDLVKVKHFDNSPVMYIIEKVSKTIGQKYGETETIFLGMKCRWFDNNNRLQEAVFSTKDLIHI